VNNFYFISLMDIIVVVRDLFPPIALVPRISLPFELDQNRQMLQESNRKLKEQDEVKADFSPTLAMSYAPR